MNNRLGLGPLPQGPAAQPQSRRKFFSTWLGKAVIGLLGFLLGVVSSYFTDFLKLKVPVDELADIGSDYASATILLERRESIQGGLWVFPFLVSGKPEVEQLVANPPKDEEEADQRFRKAGAVDPGVTIAKLIVEGKRNKPIQLVGMRALVESADAPLANGATLLGPGPEGAGHSMQVGFDLDARQLDALKITEDEYADVYGKDFFTNVPAFSKQTVELKQGERQIFQVIARTLTKYVRWRIELQVVDEHQIETVIADLNGKPIETTALVLDAGDPFIAPDQSKYSEVYDWQVGSKETNFSYARTK